MNNYLMLSAAALLVGTTSAGAGTYCIVFGTSNGGSYCDGGTIVTGIGGEFHGAVRTWTHTNDNCAGGTSQGMGILGKTKSFGDWSTMSDDTFGKNYGNNSEQVQYSFPKKIKAGKEYVQWMELNGTTAFEVNTGIIKGCGNGIPAGHGRTSTLATVKALIEARHRKTS